MKEAVDFKMMFYRFSCKIFMVILLEGDNVVFGNFY